MIRSNAHTPKGLPTKCEAINIHEEAAAEFGRVFDSEGMDATAWIRQLRLQTIRQQYASAVLKTRVRDEVLACS